jgi:hypothetical protein
MKGFQGLFQSLRCRVLACGLGQLAGDPNRQIHAAPVSDFGVRQGGYHGVANVMASGQIVGVLAKASFTGRLGVNLPKGLLRAGTHLPHPIQKLFGLSGVGWGLGL